jgi:hypothetical protein
LSPKLKFIIKVYYITKCEDIARGKKIRGKGVEG